MSCCRVVLSWCVLVCVVCRLVRGDIRKVTNDLRLSTTFFYIFSTCSLFLYFIRASERNFFCHACSVCGAGDSEQMICC